MERPEQLDRLLSPKSVAIIGASPREGSWGRTTIENLRAIGYGGNILPVNPRYDRVAGHECYPDLAALPDVPDAAVVAVAAAAVPDAIESAIEQGVPAAVVYASGFGAAGQGEGGETGQNGPRARLTRLLRDGRIAVLGPNCLGLVNYSARTALWGITVPYAHAGADSGVALIAQSGNIALTVSGANRGFALTHLISCGNQAGASAAELIGACLRDPAVRVIAAVLEGVADPLALRAVLKDAAERDKPVVVLKLGQSAKGQAATMAHTGTLSGEPALYRALFRQYGAIQVDDVDELISAAALLSVTPKVRARGVAVIASSGGECGLISDLSDSLGVPLPEIPPQVAERVATMLPDFARVSNPLDFTAGGWGDSDLYRRLVSELSSVEAIDTIIGVHDAPTLEGDELEDHFRGIVSGLGDGAVVARERDTVVANVTSINDVRSSVPRAFAEAGVVPLVGLRPGLAALAKISRRTRLRDAGGVEAAAAVHIESARSLLRSVSSGALNEAAAKDVLDAVGIRTPRRRIARTVDAAVQVARELGYPVVAKVSSAAITHKTDIGGVLVGIADDRAMAEGAARILALATAEDPSAPAEILIEEFVPIGGELIVGARRDAQFGPVVMVGLGGVLTELLGDVSHRLAPLTAADARAMPQELAGYRILQGYRGGTAADLEDLERTLLVLGELIAGVPDIVDIEMNPLVWGADGRGFVALDALLIKG